MTVDQQDQKRGEEGIPTSWEEPRCEDGTKASVERSLGNVS